ncbi:hypothetical protein MF271_08855 [Deinococcus sp. KNUC1210]|uniref:hypothetical protein n=1 Tax=Deinococcus sp. KNUC1210 TaxID=2917691 RepID=UPI001EF113BC|nr:hypothetical protein [Deinococcus sp. KNUC1210]ULH16664.1 hypothetical protein MF271_08855 [Deinococcus sp. KNUC1210]
MNIDSAGFEGIVNEVLDHEEQYVDAELNLFWDALGIVNPLSDLQEHVAALLAERGLVVSFEAHVFVPDEDEAALPQLAVFDAPRLLHCLISRLTRCGR